MDIVVPFDAREPKTRLSPVLDAEERHEFAEAMLESVCGAIDATGHEPTILATADIDAEWPVRVDDRSLSEAVNAVLAESDEAVAIVMADLALATPDVLGRVFDADGEVVLVPGRGGGTNVILARHPEFRVDYHGVSIRDHREIARRIGAQTVTIDSFRLATDVDEPADLAEVILHADTDLAEWLSRHDIEIDTSDDRTTCSRRD